MTATKPANTTPPDYDEARVIERSDGFYWQEMLTDKLYGPFPTLHDAAQDMRFRDDSSYEESGSQQEAEAEIGMAGWIDPETGEPAEDVPTHLNDK